MNINVNEKTYNLIKLEAEKFSNGDIGKYLESLMEEITEIIPTQKEKREWKENLYSTVLFLSEYYEEITPKKRDSLDTLLEKFFWWVSKKNDGYFSEMDNANTDRYCAWLVQEYEQYC